GGHELMREEKAMAHHAGSSRPTQAPAPLLLSVDDLYLFSRGEQERAYRLLGANHRCVDGVDGVLFAVWAPSAGHVAVVGDFNGWDPQRHPMQLHHGFGVWELFVPGLPSGLHYKYQITHRDGE